MSTGKRDNAYYMQRLKKWPSLYREVVAGRMSVTKARQLAGLGGTRTRLSELKNSWSKATPIEQAQFLAWLGISGHPGSTPASITTPRSAFGPTGEMLEWARRRIREIMTRRSLSSGDLAVELGLKRLDASVMMALRGDVKVNASTAAEVDRWLVKNASV